jgi:hypothetical protein
MRKWFGSLVLLAALGCASQDQPRDELDPQVIDELSTEQGSATGTAWSGTYASTFTTDSCDCPTIELQGSAIDLCMLVALAPTQFDLTQGDGFLYGNVAGAMLTGAIEADGSFVIAGRQNLSTFIGQVERLGRMDGSLEIVDGQARLSASAGQRLIGEYGGDSIDCRWLGQVSGTRVE